MNKIVHILTCLRKVFVPGQIILFYISTRLILIYQNPEIWKSSSNWIDWSWILLPYHDIGFLFIGWQSFEYHLVTEFTHVCSLSFSSSTLSADAYMETSSAIILRTHPSSVKLDISLMNSKNKMGPSTDPWGMPFFMSRYSDDSCWNETRKQVVYGWEDNYWTMWVTYLWIHTFQISLEGCHI